MPCSEWTFSEPHIRIQTIGGHFSGLWLAEFMDYPKLTFLIPSTTHRHLSNVIMLTDFVSDLIQLTKMSSWM